MASTEAASTTVLRAMQKPVLAESAREARRRANRKYVARCRERGLCVCGEHRPAVGGRKRCAECMAAERNYTKANRKNNNRLALAAYHKNKEKCNRQRRKRRLMHRYRLTLEEFDGLVKNQNGRCAVCGELFPSNRHPSIDHDHKCCEGETSCGKCIREILCTRCNSMLGLANDSIEVLQSAISYLSRHGAA